jgi:hypothetical protein
MPTGKYRHFGRDCCLRYQGLRLFLGCYSLNLGTARDSETLVVIYQARFEVLTRVVVIQIIYVVSRTGCWATKMEALCIFGTPKATSQGGVPRQKTWLFTIAAVRTLRYHAVIVSFTSYLFLDSFPTSSFHCHCWYACCPLRHREMIYPAQRVSKPDVFIVRMPCWLAENGAEGVTIVSDLDLTQTAVKTVVKVINGKTLVVWSSLVWPGLVWSGLVWPGLAWPGLVWHGLVWFSLAWSSLICFVVYVPLNL